MREDWFALPHQSVVCMATADSDSHQLSEPAAVPRNYLRVPDDEPQHFDEAAFVAAVRDARLVGITGPLVPATLGRIAAGHRFSGSAVRLRVEVRAAPWVPVDRICVYVDGREVRTGPLRLVGHGAEGTTAFAAAGVSVTEYALTFAAAAFVTIEVEGDPAASERCRALLPGSAPFAFTNPIFVDADPDGGRHGPGLDADRQPGSTAPAKCRAALPASCKPQADSARSPTQPLPAAFRPVARRLLRMRASRRGPRLCSGRDPMLDSILVLATLAFFALCGLYARACERL